MARQANAAVGGRVAGEVALVHANGTVDAKEVVHLGSLETGSWRARVFAIVDVLADDVAVGVLVVTVERGFVIDVFFDDRVTSWTGFITFGTRGYGRTSGELTALVKVDHLLTEVDDNAGFASHVVGTPEGSIIAHEAFDFGSQEAGRARDVTGENLFAVAKG